MKLLQSWITVGICLVWGILGDLLEKERSICSSTQCFSLTTTVSTWNTAICEPDEGLGIINDHQTLELLVKHFVDTGIKEGKEMWIGARYHIGDDHDRWRWSRNTTTAAQIDNLRFELQKSDTVGSFGLLERQASSTENPASCGTGCDDIDEPQTPRKEPRCPDEYLIKLHLSRDLDMPQAFICESNDSASEFGPLVPSQLIHIEGMPDRYFYVFDVQLTWLKAHHLCLSAYPGRGSLATIDSDHLMHELGQRIKSDARVDKWWTGLHRGAWRWIDGKPVDHLLGMNPDLTTGCAYLRYDGVSNDITWNSDHLCDASTAPTRHNLCMRSKIKDAKEDIKDYVGSVGAFVANMFGSEEILPHCKQMGPARAVEEVVYCEDGEDCTLECVIGYGEESQKPIDFRWTLPDGKRVNTNPGQLKVRADDVNHFGTYQCQPFIHVSETTADVDCGKAPTIYLKPKGDLTLFKQATPSEVFEVNVAHAQAIVADHPDLKQLSVHAKNFVNYGIKLSDVRSYLTDKGFTADLIEACSKIGDPNEHRIIVEKYESTELAVQYTFILLLKNQQGRKFLAAGTRFEIDITKNDAERSYFFSWSLPDESYVPPSWQLKIYRYAAYNHIKDCGIDIHISEVFSGV